MSHFGQQDFGLEASLGNVPGYITDFRAGKALDCDVGVPTDIWDGADGVTGTKVWVQPTAARIHDIVSTSVNDAAAGTGMRTLSVFGLTSWSTKEVSEVITLNGTTPVQTVNSYVILHRMRGITFGATTPAANAGTITATAVTDATVQAAMLPGNNATLMAIVGVPSLQRLAVTNASVGNISPATAELRGLLCVNTRVDQADSGFLIRDEFPVSGAQAQQNYKPELVIPGPCIAKLQAVSDTNNAIAIGNLNYYLIDV